MQLLNRAEFIRYLLDLVVKTLKSECQMQISAQSEPVDALLQQRAADVDPVALRVECGLTAFHKGRSSAESYREQIRMQTQLMRHTRNIRAQTHLVARENALDQAVKAEFFESFAVRLQADPAVIVEHIRLFAILMYNIDQFAAEGDDKTVDELHPVLFVLCRRHMGNVQLALIDEIFRSHPVSVLLLELIERERADREIIRCPVREQIAAARVGSPDPDEIIEKRGETYNIRLRMILAPAVHPVKHVLLRGGITRIDLHQMLSGPGIRDVIVHRDLFPDPVREEIHRILMPERAVVDRDNSVLILPVLHRHFGLGCSVENLPVFDGIRGFVDLELLCVILIHQMNLQIGCLCRHRSCHQEALLLAVRMLLRPFIVITDHADRRIDLVSGVQNVLGKLCSVTVTDNVRAPFLRKLQCQLLVSRFTGKCKITLFHRIRYSSLL